MGRSAEALDRLTTAFYRRVRADPTLAPVFANLPEDHPHHVALWLGEVFGGPPTYTEQVEWGTRIALANSQPEATPPPQAPVPRWGWGEAPPYTGG